MMTYDTALTEELIKEIILETDLYAKEFKIAQSRAVIKGTNKQIAFSRNPSITTSLASTVNSEYFKIATMDNELPYHIYFLDPPFSTEYPVQPNLLALFLSNFIIFLFLSIAYSFALKNKEDLW